MGTVPRDGRVRRRIRRACLKQIDSMTRPCVQGTSRPRQLWRLHDDAELLRLPRVSFLAFRRERHVVDYSGHYSDPVADRRVADVAVQLGMGLLPGGHAWPHPDHRDHPGAHRTNLTTPLCDRRLSLTPRPQEERVTARAVSLPAIEVFSAPQAPAAGGNLVCDSAAVPQPAQEIIENAC